MATRRRIRPQSAISFGTDNQVGTATVRDVATGDILKVYGIPADQALEILGAQIERNTNAVNASALKAMALIAQAERDQDERMQLLAQLTRLADLFTSLMRDQVRDQEERYQRIKQIDDIAANQTQLIAQQVRNLERLTFWQRASFAGTVVALVAAGVADVVLIVVYSSLLR